MHSDFFLGANSGKGFYSLYDGFSRKNGDFLYLLKGGPGCGKSSFMRRIADESEKRGHTVTRILCSGDPESLDGIYIKELRAGFMDATAPHAAEPGIFALDSCYLDLGMFCKATRSELLREYTAGYRSMYSCAYSYLAAASELANANIPGAVNDDAIRSVRSRAAASIRHGLSGHGSGTVTKRFISCISCMGHICLDETVNSLCERVYLLEDRFGLAAFYLDALCAAALDRGADVILCPSPLRPDIPEAVLIPSAGVAYISESSGYSAAPYRRIRLDTYALRGSEQMSDLKHRSKLYGELCDTAVSYLSRAKELHDRLEAEYRPYIDFASLDEYCSELIQKLFI